MFIFPLNFNLILHFLRIRNQVFKKVLRAYTLLHINIAWYTVRPKVLSAFLVHGQFRFCLHEVKKELNQLIRYMALRKGVDNEISGVANGEI